MRGQSVLFIVVSSVVVSCSTGPGSSPKAEKKADAGPLDPKEAIVGEWESTNARGNNSVKRFTADGRFHSYIKALPEANLGGKYRFLDARTVEYDWDPPSEGGQRRIDKRVVVFKDANLFTEAPVDEPDAPHAVLFRRVGVKLSPGAEEMIAAAKDRADRRAKDRFAPIAKDPDEADGKALGQLQGTWQCVSMHDGSDKMPDEIAQALRISIKGNDYQERKTKGVLKLDTEQKPFRIDFVFKADEGETKVRKGIFEIVDRNTLKVARTPPSEFRPTEFLPRFDVSLEVFKRLAETKAP